MPDINSVTSPIVEPCGVCGEAPAVIKLTAADADGVLLDRIAVCASCMRSEAASDLLTCGSPSKPITS
jgi:protein-arginine kinase activator protein McsA